MPPGNLDDAIATAHGRAPSVLIVDDEPATRRYLARLLTRQSCRVVEAADGAEALAQASSGDLDAVLLDVVMPGLDGLETCRRLKGDPRTAAIPVLLVTGLSDRSDRLRGIELGADDFLAKPIDPEELVLRVRNVVRTKRLRDEVVADCRRLRDLERARDDLTHLIVHDMRGPLTGMLGNLQLLRASGGDTLDADAREDLEMALQATNVLVEMVDTLLDAGRLERGEVAPRSERTDLARLVGEALERHGVAVDSPRVAFDPPARPVEVECDPDLVRRIVYNLLANAFRSGPSTMRVDVAIARGPGAVRLSVRDRGPAIPPEARRRVFERFGVVDERREGRRGAAGLGLAFCKLAAEAHGGSIELESAEGGGNTFHLVLREAT